MYAAKRESRKKHAAIRADVRNKVYSTPMKYASAPSTVPGRIHRIASVAANVLGPVLLGILAGIAMSMVSRDNSMDDEDRSLM